jgi:hypothetical protein
VGSVFDRSYITKDIIATASKCQIVGLYMYGMIMLSKINREAKIVEISYGFLMSLYF